MEESYFPEGYKSPQTIRETQDAIQEVKDYFQKALAETLNLTRVTAPLFVWPESGFNDNLNGVERPVKFKIKETDKEVEIIHSLAKWKKVALHHYGFKKGQGLYANMKLSEEMKKQTISIQFMWVNGIGRRLLTSPKEILML